MMLGVGRSRGMSGAFQASPRRRPHARRRGTAPAVSRRRRCAAGNRWTLHARTDLGAELMIALAKGPSPPGSRQPTSTCSPQRDAPPPEDDLYVSSTKLVELRNPLPDESLRPPLCVFLPPNLQTSAEDSFGSATFEEFDVGDAYDSLRRRCWSAFRPRCRGTCGTCCSISGMSSWRWADCGGPGSLPALRPGERQRRGGVRRRPVRTGAGSGLQAVRRPRDLHTGACARTSIASDA